MKKLFNAYTIILYLAQLCIIIGFILGPIGPNEKNSVLIIVLGLFIFAIAFLVGVACLVLGIGNGLKGNGDFLMPFKLKLIHIPYFIINFVLWMVVVVGMVNPFLIAGTIIVIPLAIWITFMTMMPTSVCMVALLAGKIKNGETTLAHTWFYIAMSFIFVLDVLSAALLCLADRNNKLN